MRFTNEIDVGHRVFLGEIRRFGEMVIPLECESVRLFLAWGVIAIFAPLSVSGQIFTLPNGVASGDVTQTTAVLWTHSTALGEVTFEYSIFDDFRIIDGLETVTAVDVNQPINGESRSSRFVSKPQSVLRLMSNGITDIIAAKRT